MALRDRPGVGKIGERQQGAVAAVDAVEVQVARADPCRRDPRDRAQGLTAPGSRRTDHEEVTEDIQVDECRALPLLCRMVLDAVCEAVAIGAERLHEGFDGDVLRQGRKPWAWLFGDPQRLRSGPDCRDQRAEIGVGGVAARDAPGSRVSARRRLGQLRRRQGTHERLSPGIRDRARPSAAHAPGLEGQQRVGTQPNVGTPGGLLADAGGIRGIDHVRALGGVGDPQRDAQVGIGPDLGADDPARPLRRQNQVDAERPSALRDVHQPVDEVRQLAGQGRELVDHDREAGDGGEVWPPFAEVEVVEEVLRAGHGEQTLAMPKLGPQRLERALDQVGIEVGHHTDRVRQVDAVVESRATLVVDEHEVHLVRPVRDGQARHQSLQQLALARAGRARDESVRAVDSQVDREGTVERLADHRDRAAGRAPPARFDGAGRRRLEVEHVEQAAGVRDRAVVIDRACVADRGEGASNRLEPVFGDQVGADASQHIHSLLPDGELLRVGDHDRRALLGQESLVGVDAEAVDADAWALLQDAHQARHAAHAPGAVDHHDDLRAGPPAASVAECFGARVDEGDQFGDAACRGRCAHTECGHGVLPECWPHVRQPAHPLPALLARGVG